MPLLNIWETSRNEVLAMTIQQIVAISGSDNITDGSPRSEELRKFFQRVHRNHLRSYAQSCLDTTFTNSGFVLQDIVNEVGRRLGFEVTHGVYRGRQNANNFDGLWVVDKWSFIIEVKTSDTYNIPLNKIAKYLQQMDAEQNGGHSCLLVVGRQDTATLEDQLRGSRHNWDMRIIGVDALFRALELRELSENPELSSRLVEILKPQEYTRIDQILAMVFEFATDREASLDVVVSENDETASEENSDARTVRVIESDRDSIEAFKAEIGERLAEKFAVPLTRSRSSFEGQGGDYRFSVAVSKLYIDADKHWFAYHPRQSKFLHAAKDGYFVLGYLEARRIFAIPVQKMDEMATHMNTTTPYGDATKIYHHVNARTQNGKEILLTRANSPEFNISDYEI